LVTSVPFLLLGPVVVSLALGGTGYDMLALDLCNTVMYIPVSWFLWRAEKRSGWEK
jgi:hypothetical protein